MGEKPAHRTTSRRTLLQGGAALLSVAAIEHIRTVDRPPATIQAGDSGRSGLLVAAHDAMASTKARADYVCDGTDDQIEILTALQALPAFGGKVELSEGTFNVSGTIKVQKDNTQIVGIGPGQHSAGSQVGVGTRLKAAAGLSGQVLLIQETINSKPLYGVILRDFLVDGSSLAGPVDGILFRSNRGFIDHVHVLSVSGHGVRIVGYADWFTYDTQLAYVQVGKCGAAGIFFEDQASDCHVVGAVIYGTASHGIYIKSGSQQIINTHVYDCGARGVFMQGSARNKLSNCKIEGNRGGVYVYGASSGHQIVGCGLRNNSRDNPNTYDAINITGIPGGHADGVGIVGNSFEGNGERYGVNIANRYTTRVLVTSNMFRGSWGRRPLHNLGSSSSGYQSMVTNNLGA